MPQRRFQAIEVMVAEGLPIMVCCRVLNVSESEFHLWRKRPPSARAIRHAWLTEQIRRLHTPSRGTYGGCRVLTIGLGIAVGRGTVEMLMRRAELKSLPGARRRRPVHRTPTAADLADHRFQRSAADQLWVTDITEHPTREDWSPNSWSK